MKTVHTRKIVHATPETVYAVVKDFEKYPEFLPWCAAARLKEKRTDGEGREIFIADLAIKYKFVQEVFTTEVTCDPEKRHIDIKYVKGPFKRLSSRWRFTPLSSEPDKTEIYFHIDFEFRIGLFQKIIAVFFEEAMRRMTDAFEQRLRRITADQSVPQTKDG